MMLTRVIQVLEKSWKFGCFSRPGKILEFHDFKVVGKCLRSPIYFLSAKSCELSALHKRHSMTYGHKDDQSRPRLF